MISIQRIIPVLTVAFFLIPGAFTLSQAQEETRYGEKSNCKSGENQRRVQVHYYDQEKSVPCEVQYFKDTEEPGMGQVLWRAAHEAGFCEKKMAVFIQDLADQGWDCQAEEVMPPDLQFASPEK